MARTTEPDVGFEAHPLCSEDPEGSEDDEEEVQESGPSPVPARSTRSKKTRAEEDLEDESEGDAGLSDRDEALSEGDSSYGDDPQFSDPPNLKQLVRLGQENCRTPCLITNIGGVKVAGICGQKVKDCKRHAGKRLGTKNYQYGIGSYPPILVSRGFAGHGLASGPHYTDAQILAFQAESVKEMTLLVDTMHEDESDEEEMEELSRDVRVKFASPTPTTQAKNKKKPSEASETHDLRKALAAASGGRTKKKNPPAPVLWFGMIGKLGMRWVTSDPTEAHKTVAKKHCRIDKVFQTRAESEAWLDEAWLDEEVMPDLMPRKLAGYESDSDSDSDGDGFRDSKVDKASAKADRIKKKKARRRKAKKESKTAAKKKARKPSPKRPSKKGRHKSDDESDPSESSKSSDSESSQSDPSSSSPSSSSNDDSSDSDSSSSSGSSAKRPGRHQSKKKPKKKPSKKPSKKKSGKKGNKVTNYHKFQHDDPSTGDSQRIYGMSINGMTVDKEVAPNSMRRADRGAMYTAAVDVTSLPGGWNSNKGVSEELFQETQKMAQLTQTIMASTNKLQGMEIQDTSWNSTIRHSLGKVKNREDLFDFVKKLRKSKKAAFKQETNLIQHFMYHRHYRGTFIREYSRSSLLNLITMRSFKSFFDLADAIRQLAFDYGQWEGGPAKAMLSFHSEKLIEIRQFAVSRKQLILQVYAYLRDAQAKDFYHESMAGAIWERIGSLQMATPPQNTGSDQGKCSWCVSKDLHKLFNISGQRNLCPLKPLTDKNKAKEAAKSIVDQKRADSSKDIQELLSVALVQFG
jgi:hypothetical protein